MATVIHEETFHIELTRAEAAELWRLLETETNPESARWSPPPTLTSLRDALDAAL